MGIRVEDVSLNFAEKKILDQLHLTIHANQCVGLIGANGSGKSTLLKCIYRVLKADQGAIFLDDENIERLSYKQTSQKLAVLSQHNHYNFDFSVKEVVMMGRTPHQRSFQGNSLHDEEIVSEMLKKVELTNYADRYFSTLSGGEQQRVILARALAQEPKFLILDEPTNHLDVKHQLYLMNLVKSLNITILAAIHDLNIAMMYCDYIFVLKDAKILEAGTPETILTPALIKTVYDVESEIVTDGKGDRHVIFLS